MVTLFCFGMISLKCCYLSSYYSGLVIIISQNSSKSIEPEPSSSSSSRIPSSSSSVKGASSSLIRPFIVSMSGSSTRNVAQSWQNSANSISPEPSSSISANKSFSSSSVGLKPIARIISPRSSADKKSTFFESKSQNKL